MRLIKKIIAVFLTVCMVTGLSACKKDTARELDIEEPVVITIWYQDEKYTDYIDYAAKTFSASNELVTIDYQLINDDNYVEYIYDESVHKNNAPDIFLMNTDSLEKASLMGLVSENSTYSGFYNEKNYGKAALKAATYKDKLYGYPISFNVAFTLLNADVASPVNNFNDLLDYCNNYQVNDINQNITQLVLWDPSDMFTNYCFSSGSLNIGSDSKDDSSQISVDKDKLSRSMESFLSLKDGFGISRNEYTLDQIAESFVQGKVAYTITDVSHLKTVVDSSINYAVCEIPDLGNGLESVSTSENVCAFVNPYARQLQVAKAVAHALSYDYAASLFELSGLLSSRVITTKDEAYNQRIGKIYEIYSNSDVMAKFMGGAYYYTKYEILIHQVWDGEDFNTTIDNFVNDIQLKKNK